MEEKIATIDFLDYNCQSVNIIHFNPALDLSTNNIIVSDFIINGVEKTKQGLVVYLQFDSDYSKHFDSYDVEEKTNELFDCLKTGTEDLGNIGNLGNKIYDSIYKTFESILLGNIKTYDSVGFDDED